MRLKLRKATPQTQRGWVRAKLPFVAAAAVGAWVMYLLVPHHGRRRRPVTSPGGA